MEIISNSSGRRLYDYFSINGNRRLQGDHFFFGFVPERDLSKKGVIYRISTTYVLSRWQHQDLRIYLRKRNFIFRVVMDCWFYSIRGCSVKSFNLIKKLSSKVIVISDQGCRYSWSGDCLMIKEPSYCC